MVIVKYTVIVVKRYGEVESIEIMIVTRRPIVPTMCVLHAGALDFLVQRLYCTTFLNPYFVLIFHFTITF